MQVRDSTLRCQLDTSAYASVMNTTHVQQVAPGVQVKKPILSCEACQALNLVQRIHQLDPNLKELLDQHPDLENATGTMPGTYSIKIDPTATPVVHGQRRQTAALLPKNAEKLKEMEKEGHLAKVTQPS